jgi:putative superfamily III holin-X
MMMNEAQPVPDDRSLGELFGDLTREMSTLVRQEAQLAQTEIGQKAARVGKDVGMLAAGGAVAYAGLLALVAAVIALLVQAGMTWWGSALLVGVIVAAIGGILVWKGLDALKHEDLAPRETVESIKEGAAWTRRQVG